MLEFSSFVCHFTYLLINMKSILSIILCLMTFTGFTQETFNLYPEGKIPNSKPTPADYIEKIENHHDGIQIISQITVPTLTVYKPAKPNGTAIVICPGGGYWVVAATHEGHDVAKQFVKMGITAFVLKYRIPNERTMQNPEIGPLQDVQETFRIVRQRAKEFGIDPSRVGVMGFSAGGHLASTAATHYDRPVIADAKELNLRPDFQILIYPVISFRDFGHKGSADQIVGKTPSAEKLKYYSNDEQVNTQTPPAILIHAADDNAVPIKNAQVYYDALVKNNIPAEIKIYEKGGHGFGMNNPTTKDQWMQRVEKWLKGRKLL